MALRTAFCGALGAALDDPFSSVILCPVHLLTFKINNRGTSLAVQWLRLHTPHAGDLGSIPGWGTKNPHTATKPARRNY